MNKIFFTYIILLILSCGKTRTSSTPSKISLPITAELVPENDSIYCINWKDTLGQAKGYDLRHRPREVWCIIKSKEDTLGYYWGCSTPRNYECFHTNDSIIDLFFMIGPNPFCELPESELVKIDTSICEFNSIKLNIKRDQRKELQFNLTEK